MFHWQILLLITKQKYLVLIAYFRSGRFCGVLVSHRGPEWQHVNKTSPIRINSTHSLYHDVVNAQDLGAPRVVEEVDPGQGQRQYQGAHIRPPPEHVQDGAHQEK